MADYNITESRRSVTRNLTSSLFFYFAVFSFVLLLGSTNTFALTNTTTVFTNVTNNGNPDIGSQLSFDVFDVPASSSIVFEFRNTIDNFSSNVVEVYMEGIDSFVDVSTASVAGVGHTFDTANPVNPGNPPGVAPWTTVFSIDSDTQGPAPNDGLDDSQDLLTVMFDLQSGKTFDDVVNAINGSTIRTAFHVRSIDGGGSDSYVSGGGTGGDQPVPEPSTYALFLFGLGSVLYAKRRKK